MKGPESTHCCIANEQWYFLLRDSREISFYRIFLDILLQKWPGYVEEKPHKKGRIAAARGKILLRKKSLNQYILTGYQCGAGGNFEQVTAGSYAAAKVNILYTVIVLYVHGTGINQLAVSRQ